MAKEQSTQGMSVETKCGKQRVWIEKDNEIDSEDGVARRWGTEHTATHGIDTAEFEMNKMRVSGEDASTTVPLSSASCSTTKTSLPPHVFFE